MLAILRIVEDTMVDGPGMRTAIYAAGCTHHCQGCHNPQSWDIHAGHTMTTEEILRPILADPFADVTFTGGDPMMQPEGFTELAFAIRKQSTKTIWCYTGYTLEQLLGDKGCEVTKDMLGLIDILVDGRFVQELYDISLKFRGSSNQRIINLPETLKTDTIVLWDK